MSLWFIILSCLLAPAAAQEWTRFRGPNGTGESEATTIPATWTEADYNWKVQLPGAGHASPVLWGDKIFLTSAEQAGHKRWLFCLNAADGRIVWQREYAAETHPVHTQNNFASSSAVVDEEHVYVVWATPAHYLVLALNHDGTDAWSRDLGPFASQHGYGASPIVFEDLVIINNDQDGDCFLAALDRHSGKQRWRTPRRTSVTAYSTPCVYRPAGGKSELIFNSQSHGISSIDPVSGQTNWQLEVFDKRSVSSPLVVGGLIFGSCGSGAGGNYVAAVRPGKQPELAYKVEKTAPYVPTSVARGNLLFLWGDNSIVTCIDAPSGKQIWQKRVGGNFSGSPVRIADRLYCVSAEGEVVVLAASEKYELISRHALGEVCRSTPAIAGGRMYLRTQSHLISLGGK